LEAKHAELSHAVTEQEAAVEKLQSRREQHKKLIEKIETALIPPLERGIATLNTDMDRLREEMGTELTETLSNEDRELIASLKQLQAELVAKIEAQSDRVARVGVERQKLQSLLEDNLLKRRQELTEGMLFPPPDGDETTVRRTSFGRLSSAAEAQSQRKEDLEDKQRQLDDASRAKDDIESRLEAARAVEEELRGQLIAAKNELEQLKSKDMKNVKALEEAQEKSERLLNKVSSTTIISILDHFPNCCVLIICRLPPSAPCAFRNERPTCAKSKSSDRFLHHPNLKNARDRASPN
jgi:chromosome segregation ATPase